MSNATKRYDTLVIQDANSNEVPKTAAGGKVVSWSAGHALAEFEPLERFVTDLAGGAFSELNDFSVLESHAQHVLDSSRKQRDHGWPDSKSVSPPSEEYSEPALTVEELNAALKVECQRYNDLYIETAAVIASSMKVTAELAVMCEAYFAGDTKTVADKVRGFAMAYRQNTTPASGVTH